MRRDAKSPAGPGLLVLLLLLAPAYGRAAEGSSGQGETATEQEAESHAEGDHEKRHSSRLPDDRIPLQEVPKRPNFILELGNPYLGTGNIHRGFRLPTGAIWQPTFIVFGTLRSALQSFERGDSRVSEWANRLDLFFNLQLSGTERLVIGFRPLDQDGNFSSYIFEPSPGDPAFDARYPDGDRWRDELNANIQTLYFEGDFGEIFPNMDKQDFGRTDFGFALGRQPLLFQEGMLINDFVDGGGLTRNTLLPKNTSNYRMTFFAGLDNINRTTTAGPNQEDEDASLFGILTSTDLRRSTVDADFTYVSGGDLTGDLFALGVSAVQRIGKTNTSFRLLGSYAVDDETPYSTDGALWFSEVSWTPHYGHDLFYFTTFAAAGEFSSAARDPATGGPLGRAGINFAAVGLGNYGAPLNNFAKSVAGGAVGYQKFYGALKRRQLIGELGVRYGLASDVANETAGTLRYQMALGRRTVLIFDGFAGYREGVGRRNDDDSLFGGRFEVLLKF